MRSADDLIELLREGGRRATPQRRAIFELLAESEDHPTADEVYEHLLTVMPGVSIATVYNTLHDLVALGELIKVDDLGEDAVRYDTRTDHHDHLTCVQCHALIDLDGDPTALELSEDQAAGYRILRSQVTYYGICPACQRRRQEA